jgi:hypothetical protein
MEVQHDDPTSAIMRFRLNMGMQMAFKSGIQGVQRVRGVREGQIYAVPMR